MGSQLSLIFLKMLRKEMKSPKVAQISQMMGVSIFSLISPYKLFIKLKKLKFS
ncbi:hypothetical protein MSA_1460 [Streptococcus agalactiae ILRI005]|nr:hypothetical protein MSA_1460 [Streptococcus agalactiae ILRI005]